MAQAPTKQWDKRFGGSGDEIGGLIQPTSDGGFILSGWSTSGSSGDKTQGRQGAEDYWIIKLDAGGNKQWDKTFGGVGHEGSVAVRQTSDGGYLLAGNSDSGISGDKTQASLGGYDFWVVKLDASGNKQWDKTFGTSAPDYLSTMQLTADGGCILGGYSDAGISGDKTQAGQGEQDYWIIKLDAAGTKQWDKAFGGSSYDNLLALQQTRDGGYILAGQSSSGIGGDKTQPSQGADDCWVIKLDAAGTKQWDKRFGGGAFDTCETIQQTADGGYILGCSSYSGLGGDKTQAGQGEQDYWIIKLDAAGTKQWDRTLGGSGSETGTSIQQTSDGGYIVGGSSRSGISGNKTQPSQGSSDYWLIKLDAAGTQQWDKTLGGSHVDQLAMVQLTADGGYLLGGHSFSPISGDKTQTNWGQHDYWVVKLGPNTPTATVAGAARHPVQVYPNPAHESLNIRLADSAPRTGLWFSLLDATGRVVRHQSLLAGAAAPVWLGTMPAGLYLVRLTGPDGYVATQRIQLD